MVYPRTLELQAELEHQQQIKREMWVWAPHAVSTLLHHAGSLLISKQEQTEVTSVGKNVKVKGNLTQLE